MNDGQRLVGFPGRRVAVTGQVDPLRRAGVLAALSAPLASFAGWESSLESVLRRGGVVLALRHALAPGTFDPPGFRLGDCSTQRNLNEEGRAQARRIGQWFRARGLAPREVASSPWCRCVDTAALAFGPPRVEPALGSPRVDGVSPGEAAQALERLRRAVAGAAAHPGRFDAWVTHMFVIADLTGESVASGAGVVIGPSDRGGLQVLARFESV